MPHRILIVEDEAVIRASLRDMLEMNDYQVDVAANGLQGLNAIEEKTPDLVLSDIMMPEMDGFELLEALKNKRETELLPIIMLTAKVELESKLHGLELGADDYITKPFEFRELKLKIHNLLQRYKKLEEKLSAASTQNMDSQDAVFVRKLNLLFDEQIGNVHLSIEQVASQLNMSVSTFNRWHKRILGKSPNQYMKEYRLNRAKEMIRINYGSISEIAHKTGFGSLSYFSTVYTDFFGQNPSHDFPQKMA